MPTAKTVPHLSYVHCEPNEVKFVDLGKGVLGRASFYTISLNTLHRDDPIIPSVLVHEAVHKLGAIFDEAMTVLLSWEVDARLMAQGHKSHETSLYRCWRDAVFHISYLKAKSIEQIDRWKKFLVRFYGDEITKEMIDANIDRFEKGEQENMFGERSSDYSLVPYLSIKGAIRTGVTHVLNEYADFNNEIQSENVELPALIHIWSQFFPNSSTA